MVNVDETDLPLVFLTDTAGQNDQIFNLFVESCFHRSVACPLSC